MNYLQQKKAAPGVALGQGHSRYSIADLADEFQVTHRAIRFYEDKGLLTPERRGLTRIFSRRDRARLALILRGKRLGFSLVEIKSMLDLYDLGDGQTAQLRLTLDRSRRKIEELQKQQKDIEDAISDLREGVSLIENYFAHREAHGAQLSFDEYLRKNNPERWNHFTARKPDNHLSRQEK